MRRRFLLMPKWTFFTHFWDQNVNQHYSRMGHSIKKRIKRRSGWVNLVNHALNITTVPTKEYQLQIFSKKCIFWNNLKTRPYKHTPSTPHHDVDVIMTFFFELCVLLCFCVSLIFYILLLCLIHLPATHL